MARVKLMDKSIMQINNNHLITISSILSVIVAIVVVLLKTYGWASTHSQSLLASLTDSILDTSSSLLNLIAIRFALRPPSHDHRFGNEKFQDLAVFSQSIFFFAASIFTFGSAIHGIIDKSVPQNYDTGMGVMVACSVLTLLLLIVQWYVVKKTKSQVIAVDKVHYTGDLITNFAVMISIYLGSHFWFIDSFAAIGISVYIAINAIHFFKCAIKNLVDQELDDEEKAKILSIISKHKQVKGIHELKTRYAANKPFIQFHIELDGTMSLFESHSIAESVMNHLLEAFPNADIIIHQDPYGVENDVNYRESL